MAAVPSELINEARHFAANPRQYTDEALVKRGADIVAAAHYPVRIEVRGVIENEGVTQGAAQVAARGIFGDFKEIAVRRVEKKLKSSIGLVTKSSGKATIELTAARVDKALPLAYMAQHFDVILEMMRYKPGAHMNAKLTRTLIAVDGDGTLLKAPYKMTIPTLSESETSAELVKYLEAGGVVLLVSANDLKRSEARLIIGNALPEELRNRVLVAANGGSSLAYFDERGRLSEMEGYRLHALEDLRRSKGEIDLDLIYIGDDAKTDGNDYPAFTKVGFDRALVVTHLKRYKVSDKLKANYVGGQESGTRAILRAINGLLSERRPQSIDYLFTPENIKNIVYQSRKVLTSEARGSSPVAGKTIAAAGKTRDLSAKTAASSPVSRFDAFIEKIAVRAYQGKRHSELDSYNEHTSGVRDIVARLTNDELVLAAARLHNVELARLKGELKGISKEKRDRIIYLVERVNLISNLPYQPMSQDRLNIQYPMDMIIRLAQEPAVMFLVLADKLQTSIKAYGAEKKPVIKEVRYLYAPLAERLGMSRMAKDLSDQVYRLEYPDQYTVLKQDIDTLVAKLTMGSIDRHQVEDILKERFTKEFAFLSSQFGIEYRVRVRIKGEAASWRKMERKPEEYETFNDLRDIFGVTIIVKGGMVELYRALAHVFDFVSRKYTVVRAPEQKEYKLEGWKPAVNMHIDFIDQKKLPYELQLVTAEDYEILRSGLPAHWKFKEQEGKKGKRFDAPSVLLTSDMAENFRIVHDSIAHYEYVSVPMKDRHQPGRPLVYRTLRVEAGAKIVDVIEQVIKQSVVLKGREAKDVEAKVLAVGSYNLGSYNRPALPKVKPLKTKVQTGDLIIIDELFSDSNPYNHRNPKDASKNKRSSSPVREGGKTVASPVSKRMTFAEFMTQAQTEYYSQAAQIGRDKDFTTFVESPRTAKYFGYAMARQVTEMWERMGRPEKFSVVEMGAGNGTLAAHVLAYIKERQPAFYAALEYVIIDLSTNLREVQAEKLTAFNGKVRWIAKSALDFDQTDLNDIEGVFLSNELIDDLPGHRLKVVDGQLKEIYVAVTEQGYADEIGELSSDELRDYAASRGVQLPEGTEIFVQPSIGSWQRAMAASLKRGFVISVDYGGKTEENASRGGHAVWSGRQEHISIEEIYAQAGKVNITGLVNFYAVAEAGRKFGLLPQGMTYQRDWLWNLDEDLVHLSDWAEQEVATSFEFKVLVQSKGLPERVALTGLKETASDRRFEYLFGKPVTIVLPASQAAGAYVVYTESNSFREIPVEIIQSGSRKVADYIKNHFGYSYSSFPSVEEVRDGKIRIKREQLTDVVIRNAKGEIIFNGAEFFAAAPELTQQWALTKRDFGAKFASRVDINQAEIEPVATEFVLTAEKTLTAQDASSSSPLTLKVNIATPDELFNQLELWQKEQTAKTGEASYELLLQVPFWSRTMAASPKGYLLKAVQGEKVLGFAFYVRRENTVTLKDLVVNPAARRSGVGRALVSEIMVQNPKARLLTDPVSENTRQFYSTIGFTTRADGTMQIFTEDGISRPTTLKVSAPIKVQVRSVEVKLAGYTVKMMAKTTASTPIKGLSKEIIPVGDLVHLAHQLSSSPIHIDNGESGPTPNGVNGIGKIFKAKDAEGSDHPGV